MYSISLFTKSLTALRKALISGNKVHTIIECTYASRVLSVAVLFPQAGRVRYIVGFRLGHERNANA